MSSHEEHLARMNRSGQRGGAVGSRPTVCTRLVLGWVGTWVLDLDEKVCDFGAGREARQTAILRAAGLRNVTPYDIGANDHDTTLEDIMGSSVVIMSNVLNVQATIEDVRALLATAWGVLEEGGLLVCNLPREPRYGNFTDEQVLTEIIKAGWTVEWDEKYGSGRLWNLQKDTSK